MLKLLIDRAWKKPGYTISRFFVQGERWCEAIEDTDRGLNDSMTTEEIKAKKIYGKTAIPTGKYVVTMTYSPKFRKVLPLVNDVKCFSGIRIHPLNTAEQSLGCIGVGKNTKVGMVTNSTFWTNKLIDKINEALKHGEMIILEIK